MRSRDGASGLFFGSLPNFEELVAVKATIETNKDDVISAIQPICCRELIFTEPKILVSPYLEERNQLFLVTPKVTYESSQFQELLERLEIQSTEQLDLTKSLFQFCFSFTMKQKLAPLWNKAGEFLVQGRDFMQEMQSPEHFTASVRALEEFKTNNDALINDAAISDDLCFVLPSLKKGRIFSITHQLPENCPFASYDELRKHWKLMYGYRLPSEENVFYNVQFYYIKGKMFTYPASCIRSSQVLVSPRCDHQLIFTSFLRDLSCRMPAVCGTSLTFTSSPLYLTNRLQQATHANHLNLTRTAPPQFSHCRPFAAQRTQETTRQATISPAASQMTLPEKSFQRQSPRVNNSAVNEPSTKIIDSPLFSQSLTPFVPRFTSNRVFRSADSERTVSGSLVRPFVTSAQTIPMLSRKQVQSHFRQPITNKNSGHTVNLTRAVTPEAATSVSVESRVRNTEHSSQISEREKIESAFERNSARHIHTLPEKRSCQRQEGITMKPGINRETLQSIGEVPLLISSQGRKSPTAVFSESSFQSRHDITSARSPRFSTQVSKCLPQTRSGHIITRQAPISDNPSASSVDNATSVQVGGIATLNIEQRERDQNRLLLNGNPTNRLDMSLASPREHARRANIPDQFEPFCSWNHLRPGLARKREISSFQNDDTLPKKPRSKPKLQENVDVRELAIQDQLSKVNTVTLAVWLKQRGVAVKTKDKKAELASKVKQYLALTQHEQ